MIMTYDEHYQDGDPGSVSSLGFAEKSIQYAVSKVPKEKIVLGIPFYGRIWKDGGGFPGMGIGNEEVQALIARYGGKAVFDPNSSTPYATITIRAKITNPPSTANQLMRGHTPFGLKTNSPSSKSFSW